jgi:hypothetical protein
MPAEAGIQIARQRAKILELCSKSLGPGSAVYRVARHRARGDGG